MGRTRSIVLAMALTTASVPKPQAQTPPVTVRLVPDEAESALHLLADLEAGKPAADADWARLFGTEGYRRLRQREASLKRPFTDEEFRAFIESPALRARAAALRTTLAEWSRADLGTAGGRARAYLPGGARIQARLYPVIKPASNSFVFDVKTDSAAIFLYLDPAVTRAQLENTLAHELHHIGYAAACRDASPKSAGTLGIASDWMSAFGEGLAMLAAAGGPGVHPHAASDTADRHRWDRDLANAPADLRTLEAFFTDILDGQLTGDALDERGMSFFGVQGPWYTIGYLMTASIERARGRARLVDLICEPRRLLLEYDTISRERPGLPRWSADFGNRLRAAR